MVEVPIRELICEGRVVDCRNRRVTLDPNSRTYHFGWFAYQYLVVTPSWPEEAR